MTDGQVRKRNRIKRLKSVPTPPASKAPDHKSAPEERKISCSKQELPDYIRSRTKVCHSPRGSLLSSGSDWENYSGFVNLLKVIVVLSNTRLFIDNFINFGWQVYILEPIHNMVTDPWTWTNLWVFVELHCFILVSLHIERYIAQKSVSVRFGLLLHTMNVILTIMIPICQILMAPSMPIPAMIVLMMSVITFLKLWSYVQANRWYSEEAESETTNKLKKGNSSSLRMRSKSVPSAREIEESDDSMMYPNNLTTANLYYFILSPTLCYEMTYPKTIRVSVKNLILRFAESLFLCWLLIALVQQWIIPHLEKCREHKSQIVLLYEVLVLAVPNNVIWITFFFLLFHSWLNFLAELLMFADKEFYRDWWNSQDTQYFWAAWNIPIHKWCVRHIYKPMLRSGFSKTFVNFCVFLFSATFHEVLVSVPLKRLRFYSALGMLVQVPMTIITKAITTHLGGTYGNIAVWLQIIIGQPLGYLAYVTDWYLQD